MDKESLKGWDYGEDEKRSPVNPRDIFPQVCANCKFFQWGQQLETAGVPIIVKGCILAIKDINFPHDSEAPHYRTCGTWRSNRWQDRQKPGKAVSTLKNGNK